MQFVFKIHEKWKFIAGSIFVYNNFTYVYKLYRVKKIALKIITPSIPM